MVDGKDSKEVSLGVAVEIIPQLIELYSDTIKERLAHQPRRWMGVNGLNCLMYEGSLLMMLHCMFCDSGRFA